jgi:acetyl-CoA C-acetyltransferase
MAMLERVAREAAEDAGVGERGLRALDTVAVVHMIGGPLGNCPGLLAERIGASPAHEIQTANGGDVPFTLLNHLARRVADGEVRAALVGCSNNLRTRRRAKKEGIKLQWVRSGGSGEPEAFGVNKPGHSEIEAAYGLRMPTDFYPIFENALRARRGLDLEAHRKRVGALMSGFSKVAAENPHAWFPVARGADEITVPAPDNRMIAFPYTKYMNAVIETDQAAAVLMMSREAAREMGVPDDRMVYWWGGGNAQEFAWHASERPDFAQCPALRHAARSALAEAGTALDEINHFDFYSCFPVAVEIACEMLGLDESDTRGFTVTGGLPYAGGPGNGYTLHSLATMMERLRAQPGARGLVTGNGWYLTKHSAMVVSSAPRDRAAIEYDGEKLSGQLDVAEAASGQGTVETYTVLYDREGAPARGIVLGRTDGGERFLANTPDDRALLESFAASEQVGARGRLTSEDGHCLYDPA